MASAALLRSPALSVNATQAGQDHYVTKKLKILASIASKFYSVLLNTAQCKENESFHPLFGHAAKMRLSLSTI